MIITEKRLIRQEWYETEYSKTGFDTHGWYFNDGDLMCPIEWVIKEHIKSDKFGNRILGTRHLYFSCELLAGNRKSYKILASRS
jgi:hypothetical protein